MRNDRPLKTRVLISSIILMFMVLCDIYMITMSGNLRLMAAAAFITFLWMTFTLDGWMSLREIGVREREEQYQDILKAEKASYLIFQQKFQDLDNKLNFIGQKIMPLEKANSANQKMIASLIDGLREDQKKIAKVTINRSKENADALINSNGQLMRQMDQLINSVPNAEGMSQPGSIQQEIQSLRNAQETILARLQEISSLLGGVQPPSTGEEAFSAAFGQPSVATDPYSGDSGFSALSEQPFVESQASASTEQPAVETLSPGELEALLSGIGETPVPGSEEPMAQEKEMTPEELMAQMKDIAQPEPMAQEKDIAQPEPMAQEKEMAPEGSVAQEKDVALAEARALEASAPSGEPEAKPQEQPKPQAPEAKPQEQPKPQAPEAKPARKVSVPKPNLADPNQMMSPEDIAALIANAEVEELPDAPQQLEEEKPPKPDTSDTNKMMSPEDIAALIANM